MVMMMFFSAPSGMQACRLNRGDPSLAARGITIKRVVLVLLAVPLVWVCWVLLVCGIGLVQVMTYRIPDFSGEKREHVADWVLAKKPAAIVVNHVYIWPKDGNDVMRDERLAKAATWEIPLEVTAFYYAAKIQFDENDRVVEQSTRFTIRK